MPKKRRGGSVGRIVSRYKKNKKTKIQENKVNTGDTHYKNKQTLNLNSDKTLSNGRGRQKNEKDVDMVSIFFIEFV